MVVIIFANGELKAGAWIRPYLDEGAIIIAVDGGTKHLTKLGITPDIILGDLDSAEVDSIDRMQQAGAKIISYKPDKDETDLELALAHAQSLPDGEIKVVGAFGKRLDHSLANLLLLAHPRFLNCPITFIAPDQRVWLIHRNSTIFGNPGDIVSLLPIAGDVHVAHTQGLRWPLHDEILPVGPTRGMSNELTSSEAVIELVSGKVICIHTNQEL